MPAFTFEKLSVPAEGRPATPPAEKQRGPLGQILHRLSEARLRRSLRRDRPPEIPETPETKSSK
jgi:hypothetical protein